MAVDHALCVCRTDDGGKSWNKLTNGLPQTASYDLVYRHALALDGDTLAFGTSTGNLFLSEDLAFRFYPVWYCVGSIVITLSLVQRRAGASTSRDWW